MMAISEYQIIYRYCFDKMSPQRIRMAFCKRIIVVVSHQLYARMLLLDLFQRVGTNVRAAVDKNYIRRKGCCHPD